MPFALKISFQNVFIKHFIYVRPATYRLEVCNLVRKVMVKISHKNCKTHAGNALCRSPKHVFLEHIPQRMRVEVSLKNSCTLYTVRMQFYWNKLMNHGCFPEIFLNFCNQLFSLNSSVVLKNQIKWKIIWKSGMKPVGREKLANSSFCTEYS